MPLFRMRSEKDLKGTISDKIDPVPPLPRLPSLRLGTTSSSSGPLLPSPFDNSDTTSSTSFFPSRSNQSGHRRSRSFSTPPQTLGVDLADQPWRSREAWLALHQRTPSPPPTLTIPSATDQGGWRQRGGGGSLEAHTRVRRSRWSDSARKKSARTPKDVVDESQWIVRSSPTTPPRSRASRDLASLAASERPDAHLPAPDASHWTPGTAAALFRAKSTAHQTNPPSSMDSPDPSSRPHSKYASNTSSVDSHYPPTIISDTSSSSSHGHGHGRAELHPAHTSPVARQSEAESFASMSLLEPPRPLVDVPTSPFESENETLPPLLPSAIKAKAPSRQSSYTKPRATPSPIPWAQSQQQTQPHQTQFHSRLPPVSAGIASSSRRTSSTPQTPATPNTVYSYPVRPNASRDSTPTTPLPLQRSTSFRHDPDVYRTPIASPYQTAKPSPTELPRSGAPTFPAGAYPVRANTYPAYRSESTPPRRNTADNAARAVYPAGQVPPRPHKSPKRSETELVGRAGVPSYGSAKSNRDRGGWI
ncbi:hypothetical protein EHS25_003371 [Saitozyma podzolica]|uniref:Uncharacterized protein n=1 Tax=Saitozyma podzolica TaxID=1890683 RepID=A0A427Y8P5_9TREE|nr:hypothetical protein EHS25_003371 [Saitozyma podzolica]